MPLAAIAFDWKFLAASLSILLIDLVLSGDNAVVIAMAVRNLPPRQKRLGILLGTAGAVFLRVALTFVVFHLLDVPFLSFAGGIVIFWIALKLFLQGDQGEHGRQALSLRSAVWLILVADAVMSADNILAVAGAAQGSLLLLFLGLGMSIPIVVFTSSLLSRLMAKHPVIVYIGAGILGKVGVEMMLDDTYVQKAWPLGAPVRYALYAAGVAGILLIGKLLLALSARGRKRQSSSGPRNQS